LEAGTTALVGAVIGGRIGYVLVNWVYFQNKFPEIPQVVSGGTSWFGAMIGGIIAILITARIRQTSFWELVDGLRPLLASVVVSSWLASWMTGYAYGVAVDTLLGVLARDEWGFLSKRWPVHLVGAFSALGFHWASDQLQARKWKKRPGMATSLELGGLSITIAVLTLFRADPAPHWGGIRIDAWAATTLVLMCAIASISLYSRTKI
jgi:prolipoprotein diacylglyceryltransferase